MIKKFKDFIEEMTSATGGLSTGEAGNVYSGGNAGVQQTQHTAFDNQETTSYNHSDENQNIDKELPRSKKFKRKKKKDINENAVATAGNVAGMGNVVSSQASSLPGATIGTNFSGHGGTVGSGDIGSISSPYNPGGVDTYMNQKFKIKSNSKRNKSKKSKPEKTYKPTSKVMNFKEYTKDAANTVTKIKDFGINGIYGNSYNEELNYSQIEKQRSHGRKHRGESIHSEEIENEESLKILKKVQNRLSNIVVLKIETNKHGRPYGHASDIQIDVEHDKFKVQLGDMPIEYYKLNELGKMIIDIKEFQKQD